MLTNKKHGGYINLGASAAKGKEGSILNKAMKQASLTSPNTKPG